MQYCTAGHMPSSPMSPLLLRMLPCPADRMQWLHTLMQTDGCTPSDLCMPPADALPAATPRSADHMQQLHALMHLDGGVDLPALHRCLEVSLNIYRYMIQ